MKKKIILLTSLFTVFVAVLAVSWFTRVNGLETESQEVSEPTTQQETQENLTLKNFAIMLDGKTDEEIDDYFYIPELELPDYTPVIATEPEGFHYRVDFSSDGYVQVGEGENAQMYSYKDPTVSATVGEIKEYFKSLN